MSQYTAVQLRNAWKPVMVRLGFRIEHSCFVKSHGPVKHSVILERRKSSRDVLVKLFVSVSDPFERDEALKDRVCLLANLHQDGVRFASMQWDENELACKASVFEQFGPPFFEQFQSIGNLLALVEAAQAKLQRPEDYLRGPVPEPSDPFAREFLSTLPIRRPRPIPANEELLALLHWHNGDSSRAVEHVRRYLELLPDDIRGMKARLAAMMRPVI